MEPIGFHHIRQRRALVVIKEVRHMLNGSDIKPPLHPSPQLLMYGYDLHARFRTPELDVRLRIY